MEIERACYEYADSGERAYPLDDAVGLFRVGAVSYGYTPLMASKLCELGSELTNLRAAALAKSLMGVGLAADTISALVDAVGAKVRAFNAPSPTPRPEARAEEGFIAKRLGGETAAADMPPTGLSKVIYIEADGTGVPGVRAELNGVAGKQPDGTAKTFEAKVGAVFTQSFDSRGKPLLSKTKEPEIFRDPGSTKYMGTVEKADKFGPMLFEHAARNGLQAAADAVFLADGGAWLWNIKTAYFPNAIGIVDFFHAIENMDKIIDRLRFHKKNRRDLFKAVCRGLLEDGDIDGMTSKILEKASPDCRPAIDKALGYFRDNRERMRYKDFREAGLFIGSGIIESAAKLIVGKRLKQSGMHWKKKTADNMIALRCAIQSNEFLPHLDECLSQTIPKEFRQDWAA